MLFIPLFLQQDLIVDPLLVVQAQEVWSVIGKPDNRVWPGWNARKTPILIYFPGKQDLLINHPKPPAGFEPYRGAVKSTIGPMAIRTGTTLEAYDGQNTHREVNGVPTLVVADTLSTRRQWVEGLAPAIVANPDRARQTIESSLFPNPYASMATIAHEAFHVYQQQRAPKKFGNELALVRYPSLSVENNVGMALEADLLAAISGQSNPKRLREAAVEWLAVRNWRRQFIGKEGTDYEDGTEFSEGTAKYIEFRLLQSLEGRTPSRELWLTQGFCGFADLSGQRKGLVESMQRFMAGKQNVNNDRYGASPVRFRLYYSGMGIGILLDRLGAKWHERILTSDLSLTDLVREALRPTTSELEATLSRIKTSARYAALWAEKEELAKEGEGYIEQEIAAFEKSPGELVIDYTALQNPKLRMSFTPFGILRVDDEVRLFRLLPVRGMLNDLSFAEESNRPVLDNRRTKTIRLQLTGVPDPALSGRRFSGEELQLPGVRLQKVSGTLRVEGRKAVLRVTS